MGLKSWKEHVLKITLNAMKLPLNVKTISRLGINHCKTASHFRTTSVLKRQKFAVEKESSEKTVKMTVQPTQMVISALVEENVRVAATSRKRKQQMKNQRPFPVLMSTNVLNLQICVQ